MFETKRDNIRFIDTDTNEIHIMNHRTFLMIIHGILTHYLRYTDKEAQNIIEKEPVYNDPKDSQYASLLTHDLCYDWAMFLAHGNEYWNNGYTEYLPEDYYIWEEKYIKQHNLAESVCEFLPL